MKLSSLNRFKGKRLCVGFWDRESNESNSIDDLRIEDIETDSITFESETGLLRLLIDDLISIDEINDSDPNARVKDIQQQAE